MPIINCLIKPHAGKPVDLGECPFCKRAAHPQRKMCIAPVPERERHVPVRRNYLWGR